MKLYTLPYTEPEVDLRRVALSTPPASPWPGPLDVRHIRTDEDFAACVELQHEIWGAHFSERVPAAILKVSQRIGGVTAGAFDARGRLLGFVFGISGIEDGKLVHWSDMLAVREEARQLGLGRRLKEFQRDSLRALGVEKIYWTFDPLVARNAYFNIVRLGVDVVEYVRDMYGETGSGLHRGVGTDRFIVVWKIADQDGGGGTSRAGFASFRSAPVLADDREDAARELSVPSSDRVRIAIPADIEAIQGTSLAEAGSWRARTRRAFLSCLERGYRVVGFQLDAPARRGYYLLETSRPDAGADHPELMADA